MTDDPLTLPDGTPEWTEGVTGDGAVILRDGQPVPIQAIVQALNAAQALWSEYEQLQFEDKPQHDAIWAALGRALKANCN